MKIELVWADFKTDIISKGFVINYKKIYNDVSNPDLYGYEVFAVDRSLEWISILTSSEDIIDFESNYKVDANINIGLPRTKYKNGEVIGSDLWQYVDLGEMYLDISITLRQINGVWYNMDIKLNTVDNDMITLTEIYNDIVMGDFKITRFYYKASVPGQLPKVFYIALK